MKEYVLGLAFNASHDHIVLIRKNRPAWQAGKLNGPGGLIEDSEHSMASMQREFFQETTVQSNPSDWSHFLTIAVHTHLQKDDYRVYCFATDKLQIDQAQTVTDELVCIFPIIRLLHSQYGGLAEIEMVENLPWMILLAIDHLNDGRPASAIVEYFPTTNR